MFTQFVHTVSKVRQTLFTSRTATKFLQNMTNESANNFLNLCKLKQAQHTKIYHKLTWVWCLHAKDSFDGVSRHGVKEQSNEEDEQANDETFN